MDGQEFTLCKVYKENWTKKRGQLNAVFTGHTTDCFINDVPVKRNTIKGWVDNYKEQEFNLLSNPMYFNSTLDQKEEEKFY